MVGHLQIEELKSVESSISMLRADTKCRSIILVRMITEVQTVGIMAYHNFPKFQDKQSITKKRIINRIKKRLKIR